MIKLGRPTAGKQDWHPAGAKSDPDLSGQKEIQ